MPTILKIEVFDSETMEEIRSLERRKHLRVLSDIENKYDASKILALSGALAIDNEEVLEIQRQLRNEWNRF
jgi:hypothetical protein